MSGARATGLLGGTFDPIHCGHLDAALAVRRALRLDEVLLVPGGVSPHRRTPPRASSFHRFAMVALASADAEGLLASDLELAEPGPSYTARTLDRLLQHGYSPSQLFFITGADAFADIAAWYDYPAVLERGHFVVVSRPGHPVAHLRQRLPALASRMREVSGGRKANASVIRPSAPAIFLLEVATADVSSTEIRRRVAHSQPIDGLTPPMVDAYIRRHRLYLPGGPTADDLHEQS